MKKEATNSSLLTRGKVSAISGIGIEAIRFYEQQGLIPKPKRSSSGYRQYSPDAVKRILFIQQAKELGFSLKEISELLTLRVNPQNTCGDVKKMATDKIENINQKIRDLRKIKRALEKLALTCRGKGLTSECPILGALETTG